MLDLVYENHTTYPELNEEIFRDILGIILKHFKMVQDQVEIGIQAVDEKTMRELNNEHRQKDKPTDVLSFPLDESNLRKYGIIALDIMSVPQTISLGVGVPVPLLFARTLHCATPALEH